MTAPAARPLWRTFIAFLGPLILANILQSLSGTLNNVYVGHMLGVKALAAVSAFFPILFFFIAFIIGLGSGAAVLIGQAWGAKKPEAVKTVAGTTLSVGFIVGLAVAFSAANRRTSGSWSPSTHHRLFSLRPSISSSLGSTPSTSSTCSFRRTNTTSCSSSHGSRATDIIIWPCR